MRAPASTTFHFDESFAVPPFGRDRNGQFAGKIAPGQGGRIGDDFLSRITSYNVCYTKLLRTAGGDVRLISQGDVIVDAGARIDVSGGWTRFLSADIVSTVLSANGRLFDFEVAPADIVYTGP